MISTPAYASGHEHIADLLSRHDWVLRREIARGNARKPSDLLGFAAITEQEVHHLLRGGADAGAITSAALEEIERAIAEIEARIAARVASSIALGVRLPLIELAKLFSLSPPEIDILFTCLAVELDRRYERVYGFLHDDMSRRHASIGLALNLYAGEGAQQLTSRALLSAAATLRRCRLTEVPDETASTPSLSRALRIDDRLLAYVLADEAMDARLARYSPRVETQIEPPRLGKRQQETLGAVLREIKHWRADGRRKPLVYVHDAHDAGSEIIARAAAQDLRLPLIVFDVTLMAEQGAAGEAHLGLMFREAVLRQAVLLLRNVDQLLEHTSVGAGFHHALLDCVSQTGVTVFAAGQRAWAGPLPTDPVVLHVAELSPAGATEQLEAWRAFTRDDLPTADLHRLISLHPLPLAAIGDTWHAAEVLAAAEGEGVVPSLAHLRRACRARMRIAPSSLARRIEPRHGWNDLILPAAQREQLAALCAQAKHASVVYGAWGFERKLSLGKSLNTLFCGPPGTGKTMAAEVIAAELGVELLKIDLSQVVSKYIGETEKNLRQLFDQAARAHAILFFDEADALLGKRSEVKDAHDRYANIETAYLLQKLEEYPGIAILATNLRQNLDDAFTRRMSFVVNFTFPEEEYRLRIWQSVWPSEVPLAPDVDMTYLAKQFRLSGGSIKNVALAAAFFAAEQEQRVSMRHVLRAACEELLKMGRLLSAEMKLT